MADQTTNDNIYTRKDIIGEGTQDYFGPIDRRYFSVAITKAFGDADIFSAKDLSLVVEMNPYPHGGSHRDYSPGDQLIRDMERLFSHDDAVRDVQILSILNRHLTNMRASGDFMPALKKVRKSVEGDKAPVHPMLVASVAGMIAEKPHRQNHASYEDFWNSVTPEERAELQAIYDLLSQPNNDIDFKVGSAKVEISGIGLPKAIEKLSVSSSVIRNIDLSYLRRDLEKWKTKNSDAKEFIEREINPVITMLGKLDDDEPLPPRVNSIPSAVSADKPQP